MERPDRRFVGERKYSISKIWDVHAEIVRRLVIGQKAVDIAADLNITPEMVSYTRNSPIVKRQLDIQHGARDADVFEVNQEIAAKARVAVQKLGMILENDNIPSLQFKAAVEILDRVSPKVHRYEGIHAQLTAEDIEALKNRAVQAAADAGLLSA